MPMSRTHQAAVVSKLRDAGCVFAEEEAQLLVDSAKTPDELMAMVERRVAGEPLEHVVGWAEFCGLRVAVSPAVFVPRRRTELLVRRAAAVHAVDIEPTAVGCARRNLTAFGGEVYTGDLYEALPVELRGTVDVLV